jgi:hypothetical protein
MTRTYLTALDVLKHIIRRHPGLIVGEEFVDGAELVSDLGRYLLALSPDDQFALEIETGNIPED